MTELVETEIQEFAAADPQEVKTFKFEPQQAHLLHEFSEDIAALGGPQAKGAQMRASLAATELKCSFFAEQHEMIYLYSNERISLMIFEGLQKITEISLPEELPALSLLENRHDILCLAARNQILLKLVDHRAFAYDIDNGGKVVRLVANFKGGGAEIINAEPEKSS